jgi:predicted phage baseplate assembly protein
VIGPAPRPRPRPGGALAAGSDHGLLLDPADAGAGDQVVVVLVPDTTATPPAGAEEKILAGVDQLGGRSRLSWSPPVRHQNGGLVMRRWTRKFLLFGHDAPARYTTVTGTGTNLTWSRVDTDFKAPAEKAVYLDSIVDSLAPGAEILLVNDGVSARILQVTGAGPAGASIGASDVLPALEATVTKLDLELGQTETSIGVADVRQAVVYELAGPPIRFWDFEYPDRVDGDAVYVPLDARPDLAALAESAAGRLAILDDRQARPQTVMLTGAGLADVDGDGRPDHLELRYSPKLERALDSASAVLWGNVARATHGETVAAEVLGDGDAAAGLQAFRLAKRPLTYVPAPGAQGGVTSTLRVEANGMHWEETPTLLGRGPDERVYTLRRDDDGATVVRFGDGRTGARLPTGRGNVVAGYRAGLGTDGRVRAGTLTNPRTRPVGLRRVTNPGPASGGANPESAGQTRTSAPNTVRTFGRVVSLRDFEDAALQVAGVGKARAAAVWDGEEQVVQLTVAGDDGAQITGQVLEQLVADLDRRRDPNRVLRPVPYHEVAVQVVAAIRVRSGYVPEAVLASARAALLALFAFERREFGQPVHLSDVYRALQETDGVAAVMVTRLRRKPPADAISPPEIETPVPVGPSELAALREPDADVRIE